MKAQKEIWSVLFWKLINLNLLVICLLFSAQGIHAQELEVPVEVKQKSSFTFGGTPLMGYEIDSRIGNRAYIGFGIGPLKTGVFLQLYKKQQLTANKTLFSITATSGVFVIPSEYMDILLSTSLLATWDRFGLDGTYRSYGIGPGFVHLIGPPRQSCFIWCSSEYFSPNGGIPSLAFRMRFGRWKGSIHGPDGQLYNNNPAYESHTPIEVIRKMSFTVGVTPGIGFELDYKVGDKTYAGFGISPLTLGVFGQFYGRKQLVTNKFQFSLVACSGVLFVPGGYTNASGIFWASLVPTWDRFRPSGEYRSYGIGPGIGYITGKQNENRALPIIGLRMRFGRWKGSFTEDIGFQD